MLTYDLLDSFLFPVRYQRKVLSLKRLAKWARHIFNASAKKSRALEVFKNGSFIGQVQSIGDAFRLTGVNRESIRLHIGIDKEFHSKQGDTFIFIEIK
jgi:hypothetical protein